MSRSAAQFTVEVGTDRPWVTVWDPQGFRDEGCQAFLSFWADQDRGPYRLRREARDLGGLDDLGSGTHAGPFDPAPDDPLR